MEKSCLYVSIDKYCVSCFYTLIHLRSDLTANLVSKVSEMDRMVQYTLLNDYNPRSSVLALVAISRGISHSEARDTVQFKKTITCNFIDDNDSCVTLCNG